MDDESMGVFIKRVLSEKHISGIMCENPGEGGIRAPLGLNLPHDCW